MKSPRRAGLLSCFRGPPATEAKGYAVATSGGMAAREVHRSPRKKYTANKMKDQHPVGIVLVPSEFQENRSSLQVAPVEDREEDLAIADAASVSTVALPSSPPSSPSSHTNSDPPTSSSWYAHGPTAADDGLVSGLWFLVLLSLVVVLLRWGRLCAILWTTACILLAPRRDSSTASNVAGTTAATVASGALIAAA